ncbi:hypothetical protein B0T25DRAFT_521526 [Lasiosphaeria hispida]|uniref:Uncharacterized protein n=1 Tax=Lasiosphaeria hispida TaxID=260671 RepID=A0AAJ0HCX6_9PEZI|nr:hypothetical protein B0T25DRAFT_521526 [Lasiosphaeria hispida]
MPTEAGKSPNESSGWGRVHMGRTIVVPDDGKARAVSFDPPIVIDPQPAADTEEAALSPDIMVTDDPDAEGPAPSRDVLKVTTDRAAGFLDEGSALDTFDHASFKVPIPTGSPTLKVTLVWTDPAGQALQNDLDLIVVAPNGQTERHGNMGTREFPFKMKAARDKAEAVTPTEEHAGDRAKNYPPMGTHGYPCEWVGNFWVPKSWRGLDPFTHPFTWVPMGTHGSNGSKCIYRG